MKASVVIVDLGLGNLFSVKRVVEHVGAHAVITDDISVISEAEKIILPGVGSFKTGMKAISSKGLLHCLKNSANSGVPILGICLGMQMLMESSNEHGYYEGLGIIPGKVNYIGDVKGFKKGSKVPHIGWSQLKQNNKSEVWNNSILARLGKEERVYFVHSYCVLPDKEEHVLSFSEYEGLKFVSSIKYNNVTGCQFHPEKSGQVGLEIMKNFVKKTLIEG